MVWDVGDVGGVGEWRGLQNADTVEQTDRQAKMNTDTHTSTRPDQGTALVRCVFCVPPNTQCTANTHSLPTPTRGLIVKGQ